MSHQEILSAEATTLGQPLPRRFAPLQPSLIASSSSHHHHRPIIDSVVNGYRLHSFAIALPLFLISAPQFFVGTFNSSLSSRFSSIITEAKWFLMLTRVSVSAYLNLCKHFYFVCTLFQTRVSTTLAILMSHSLFAWCLISFGRLTSPSATLLEAV